MYSENPTNTGVTVTNAYGLYVENITAGTGTNYAAIFAGGKVVIGGTTDSGGWGERIYCPYTRTADTGMEMGILVARTWGPTAAIATGNDLGLVSLCQTDPASTYDFYNDNGTPANPDDDTGAEVTSLTGIAMLDNTSANNRKAKSLGGVSSQVRCVKRGTGTATVDSATGLRAELSFQNLQQQGSGGIVTYWNGLTVNGAQGTGTVTNFRGIHLESPQGGGSTLTIGTSWTGILIDSPDAATDGTTYTGIHVKPVTNATANNYAMILEAGLVGIGTATPNVTLDLVGGFATRAVSPAQITDNVNDFNLGSGTFFRLDSTNNFNITGIAGGVDGRRILLVNIGNWTLSLQHEDVLSGPSNRITTPSGTPMGLGPKGRIDLIYDSVTQRWRVL